MIWQLGFGVWGAAPAGRAFFIITAIIIFHSSSFIIYSVRFIVHFSLFILLCKLALKVGYRVQGTAGGRDDDAEVAGAAPT